MSDFIENLESRPLTEGDLRKVVGQDPQIFPYSHLRHVISIEDLFPMSNGAIILYKQRPTFGHWVALILDEGTGRFSYFDSYGKPPDYWLDKIGAKRNKELGQLAPWLSQLIRKGLNDGTIKDYEWNKQELQSSSEDVANCGRYAALRVLYSDLNNRQFVKMISDNVGSGSVTDKNVALLTALQLP